MFVNGPDTLNGADLDLYLIIVSYTLTSAHAPNSISIGFYPFYRAHGRHQQTARHAHRHTETDHATVRRDF